MCRYIVCLGVVLVFGSSAALAQRMQLVNQPLTINAPAGFVDTSWEHVSEGFPLHFNLPLDTNGGRSAYPEISIVASSEAIGEDVRRALSDYARRRVEGNRPIIQARFIQIAGRQSIEFSVSGNLILDFSGGGASVLSLIAHEIAIEYQSRLYYCRLSVEPRNYVPYIKVLHEFCNSARFGDTQ